MISYPSKNFVPDAEDMILLGMPGDMVVFQKGEAREIGCEGLSAMVFKVT